MKFAAEIVEYCRQGGRGVGAWNKYQTLTSGVFLGKDRRKECGRSWKRLLARRDVMVPYDAASLVVTPTQAKVSRGASGRDLHGARHA